MGVALKQTGLTIATLIVGCGAGWAGHQYWTAQRPEAEIQVEAAASPQLSTLNRTAPRRLRCRPPLNPILTS